MHDYLPVPNELGLIFLIDGRMTANLVFFSKLIEGCIDAPSLISQFHFRVRPRFSGPRYPFVILFRHTNYGKNSPIDRMMHLTNEHPTLFIL